MLLWGLFWGAVFGAIADGFTSTIAGAVLGALAGLTLRAAVRGEIESRMADALRRARAEAQADAAAHATARERQPMRDIAPDTAAPDIAPTGVAASGNAASAPTPQDPSAPDRPVTLPPAALDPDFDLDPADPQTLAATPPITAASAARTPFESGTHADAPRPSAPSTSPRTPPRTPADTLPDPADLASRLRDWLFGGNTVVRVGALLLFLGLAFLVRWAAERAIFPIGARVAMAGLAGLALLATGWRLRTRKPEYAMTLQGAGVGIVYLTAYAALRLYDLIAPGTAFAVMTGICALATVLALRQDSMSLAVLAFGGGFAAPVLASTGHGSHVVLFGWYALLDCALLFIAARRSWRLLNLVGFFATFAVATVWGVLRYEPALFASTEPFLLLFFGLFTATAALQALRGEADPRSPVDGTLVFGTPLVAFTLQSRLVADTEYGLAWSALALGLLYLGLWRAIERRRPSLALLADAFLALGLGFATVAVPLAFGSGWTSAVFALEGAGVAWFGLRQRRWLPRAVGALLQPAAGVFFLDSVSLTRWQPMPFANEDFVGAALLAAAGMATAWWLHRAARPLPAGEDDGRPVPGALESAWLAIEGGLAAPFWLLGFGWALAAFALDITRNVVGPDSLLVPAWPRESWAHLMLLAYSACALGAWWLAGRLGWAVARLPARMTLFVLAAVLAAGIDAGVTPIEAHGGIAWPVGLAVHFWLLRAADRRGAATADATTSATRIAKATAPAGLANPLAQVLHAGSVWLIAALVGRLVWHWIDTSMLWRHDWAAVVNAAAAAGLLLALVALARAGAARWPMADRARAWMWAGALPVAALALLGNAALASLSSGDAPPLPWLPLANPVDLTLVLGLVALGLWWRQLRDGVAGLAEPAAADGSAPLAPPAAVRWLPVPIALAAFLDINTMWLRIVHHHAGVAWTHEALFHSPLVQLGYALLWTALAFALMLGARRAASRSLWLCGAGLLGLVVLKLFVVDLANAGSGERIAAFIGTGLLMLVVGYVAPMPPAEAAAAEDR